MQDSLSRDARITLDLALTVRHDGHGGVADDLTDPAGLTTWVRAHPDTVPDAAAYTADAEVLTAVRELRAAVRALFARAVRP
ncbi:ABATE domain-containing protein, partial [Streptomyces sp. KR55]|uniref:ABATE domain-containing protein n=1 Tax=Streptomyces sp. KR55 TaxID=3457425 RepID=UPI003FCF9FFD